MGISKDEYGSFEKAYDHFNRELFNGGLPCCLITLNRKANSRGYFHAERFTGRGKETRTDELAMNPDTFTDRTDKEILSTLAHEMAHVWQAHHGKTSRNGYHNAQWADKMETIGLMPSTTGADGGKRTGQRVTHYIIDGGPFDVAADNLLNSGFKLKWQSPVIAGAKKPSKVKFSCPDCGQNAWGKPDLKVICGGCGLWMMPMG